MRSTLSATLRAWFSNSITAEASIGGMSSGLCWNPLLGDLDTPDDVAKDVEDDADAILRILDLRLPVLAVSIKRKKISDLLLPHIIMNPGLCLHY